MVSTSRASGVDLAILTTRRKVRRTKSSDRTGMPAVLTDQEHSVEQSFLGSEDARDPEVGDRNIVATVTS